MSKHSISNPNSKARIKFSFNSAFPASVLLVNNPGFHEMILQTQPTWMDDCISRRAERSLGGSLLYFCSSSGGDRANHTARNKGLQSSHVLLCPCPLPAPQPPACGPFPLVLCAVISATHFDFVIFSDNLSIALYLI